MTSFHSPILSRFYMPRRFPNSWTVSCAMAIVSGSPCVAYTQGLGRDTLAAVVVTATREAVATAVPTAAVTVLSGEQLRGRGLSSVADALRLVPGVSVVNAGSVGAQTSLFVRGGNSNYVRVLVDGVPLNDAGGAVDLSTLSLENIERIEFVRGPSSVLYGSDAVTGVVQLFTRRGTQPVAWNALVGTGSHGARRSELGLSGGGVGAGFSLSGGRQSTNGELAFNNRFASDVLSGAAHWTPELSTSIALAARWSGSAFQYPTDFAGAIVDHNAEQIEHRFVVSADIEHHVSDAITGHLLLTSNEYLPRSNDAKDNAADTLGFYAYFSRSVRTRRAAELRVSAKLSASTWLTIGGEVARDRERTTSHSQSQYGPSSDAFEASRHTDALFAQLLGNASPAVSYVGGVRLDRNSAFGTFGTARGGAAWKGSEHWRARASLGSAFKAPSYYENFAVGYVKGNPALRPERAQSAEVGVDADLSTVLAVKATAYTQQFRDVIQYTGAPPSPSAPNYFNVAAADARGVELEADWRADAVTTVRASYAYTATRTTRAGYDASAGANYVVGERLLRRPPHAFSLMITQKMTGGGSFDLGVTRVGERSDRDYAVYPAAPVVLPGYTKLDVSTTIPLEGTVEAPVSLVLRVNNALDAKYQDVLHFDSPRRTLFAGVRWGR